MRFAPNSAVLAQLAAPQPKLLTVLACYFAPSMMTPITAALLLHPSFREAASNHGDLYTILFFCAQIVLTFGVVVLLSARYATSIWSPQPRWSRSILPALVVITPLLSYHLANLLLFLGSAASLLGAGEVGLKALAGLHSEVWPHSSSTPTITSIACYSVMSLFVAPVFEEVIFSGFVMNIASKRIGWKASVIVVSAFFALAHSMAFGLGLHLVPLFFQA